MTFTIFAGLVILFVVVMSHRGNSARSERRNYTRLGQAKRLPVRKVAKRLSDYL